jgi:hypothetical protein
MGTAIMVDDGAPAAAAWPVQPPLHVTLTRLHISHHISELFFADPTQEIKKSS